MPITLSDCPIELLLDNLLPLLPIPDLLALSATSHFFSLLCADDTFWKRKLDQDFNFSGNRTARKSGWRFIYKGLSNPRVYVWGESDHGRLGLASPPKAHVGKVPFPVRLNVPGIVSLIAGGWSFHALDSHGGLFVWGTLEGGNFALNSDGFSVSYKTATTPLRLELPVEVRQVSCGRLHSMALDAQGQIWTFLCWGRPYSLTTHVLDNSSPDTTPIQIECGWSFSAALTESGFVAVWWPMRSAMLEKYSARMDEMDAEGDKHARATETGVIPCVTWNLQHDPARLPPLPKLPPLNYGDAGTETKLIKIAAMEGGLIGLTNGGHTLMFSELESGESMEQGRWVYLPKYSELEEGVHISHISAHFRTFVAYSTGANSVVLMGDISTNADTPPTVVPSLQNRAIISVVVGDYHFGALTEDGTLLTWGGFSNGALGLGDPADVAAGAPGGFHTEEQRVRARGTNRFPAMRPPNVEVPTEVRFDHGMKKRKKRFCFAAAAAGWHMGALVIDLDQDGEEEVEEETAGEEDDAGEPSSAMPGHYNPLPVQGPGDVPLMPVLGHAMPFRIGFAGRGAYRARGNAPRGRGLNPNPDEG